MITVVLFDGNCGFCSSWMEFIAKRDRNDLFRFAELGSEGAARILMENGIGTVDVDSVIVIRDGRILTHSSAVVAICEALGGPYRMLGFASRVIPKSVRDVVYGTVAKYRMSLSRSEGRCEPRSPQFSSKLLPKGDSII